VIGTGGTIASQGNGPLDTQDYASSGRPILDAAALVAGVPALAEVAEVIPVPFSALPSTAIGWPEWRALHAKIAAVKAAHPAKRSGSPISPRRAMSGPRPLRR
jgi:L-asparaginase